MQSLQALIQAAQEAFARGAFEESLARYREAIDQRPDHQGLYPAAGRCLLRLDRAPEAKALLQEHLDAQPDSVPGLIGLAEVARHERQWVTALELYSKARLLQSDHPGIEKALDHLKRQLDALDRRDSGEEIHLRIRPSSRTLIPQLVVQSGPASWQDPLPEGTSQPNAQSNRLARSRPVRLKFNNRALHRACDLKLTEWETIHVYCDRFVLKGKEDQIACVDQLWPTTITFDRPDLSEWDADALLEVFLWGFVGPVLEWEESYFSTRKRHAEDMNFWQYPCRTEQDAFERHKRLDGPVLMDQTCHVYVGMPWATWIDKWNFPEDFLNEFAGRIMMTRQQLAEAGLRLQVHSVCQHIHWAEFGSQFEKAGVTDLWISHKQKAWDHQGGLRLHAWPLYAVNVLEPDRGQGLVVLPTGMKTTFASFKGSYGTFYPSDLRLRLKVLECLERYSIEVGDTWHFDQIVYGYQIRNQAPEPDSRDRGDVVAYNCLLSNSLFSLCPGGSGPNTLRLWESLAVGSIPVVLSDAYEFPRLHNGDGSPLDWEQAVIIHPENELDRLDARLLAIDEPMRQAMQAECLRAFSLSQDMLCF